MTSLKKVARAYGIELAYTTIGGQRCEAKEEVLAAVINSLGLAIPKGQLREPDPRLNRGEIPLSPRYPSSDDVSIKAFSPPAHERRWGIFVPLYALHSKRSWGGGDFTDLENLIDWVAELGGSVVGTLPLLASFLHQSFSPSPYLPASRLFWNEFFLDVEKIPELQISVEAQRLIASAEFQGEIDRLRREPLIDYRRQMALKRQVLELLSDTFFRTDTPRREAFRQFLLTNPRLEDYARFRARDEKEARYHQYVQWLTNERLRSASEKARAKKVSLFLDFPLGVHPDSYDVHRFRDLFVEGVTVGAPPDLFFAKGQNWGFPPLHPLKIRQEGYRYLTDCLRNHLQFGKILRIDHVMGLHRLFWIPDGFEAVDGVYVRYPTDDLYRLLCMESQRHSTIIVGEDLGTVPPEVRPAMRRHGLLRTYVAQSDPGVKKTAKIPPHSVASLNTHDMPLFAAIRSGSEKTIREELRKGLKRLAESPAKLVLVNLEDLWLEKEPQNVPGTADEFPNWRRKARLFMDQFQKDREICDILRQVDQWRREAT